MQLLQVPLLNLSVRALDRLASGRRTPLRSTSSPRNDTLPSAIATLQPPGWLLPMLTLL